MSWKARQMVPGKDTIRVIATHYGLKPSQVVDIARKASAPLIREDGFESRIHLQRTRGAVVGRPWRHMVSTPAWSDGSLGVDPMTTKITRPAINAVADYAFRKLVESQADN